ncbi:MAG: succinate dehydrogenase assembly factor 2 [Methylomonas sp.]|nr:MAG: succinate dehydrogenase assembly factor 2 [Methylomonas sp.]
MSDSASLNKLRWRCRRGALELDVMLLRYLEGCYMSADEFDQQSFIKLLEREDTELLRYLIGENAEYPSELTKIILKIRALSA